MSILTLAGIAALIMTAAFVQGVMGFGFGLVSMATLPLLIGVKASVPVVACLSLLLNVVLLFQLRDALALPRTAPLAAGGVFGIPLGVAFLKQADPTLLLALLGVIIIGLAIWLGRKGAVRDRPASLGVIAGFIGGILGGAFNTSGPPVVAYVGSKPWEPREIRATLLSYFMLVSVFQLSLFVYGGLLEAEAAMTALPMALPLALGAVFGDWLSGRLSPARFRLLIRIGLGVLGAVMLSRSVLTWVS